MTCSSFCCSPSTSPRGTGSAFALAVALALVPLGAAAAPADVDRSLGPDAPNVAEQRYKIGIDLYRQGKFEAAANEFRVAQGLMPDSPKLAYNLARSLERAGETDDAIAQYERYLDLSPDAEDADDVKRVIETLRSTRRSAPEGSSPDAAREGATFPWHAAVGGLAFSLAGGAVVAGLLASGYAEEAAVTTGPDVYEERRGRSEKWAGATAWSDRAI